mgnify:FL=1
MRKTGPVNDFAPTPHGASAAGVLVRPAEPGDATRVARLLTLRGTSVEESREQAHRMISSLPVLLLALLPAAEAAGGEGPAGGRAADLDDDLLAPVALSGAFPLPRRLRASLPEPSDGVEAWMVSGLVIDPVARRGGVGRVLLTAVADAVQALRPAADLYSVVNATNHASIGLHLMVGFKRLARLGAFGTVTFEDGQGVLLRRAG